MFSTTLSFGLLVMQNWRPLIAKLALVLLLGIVIFTG